MVYIKVLVIVYDESLVVHQSFGIFKRGEGPHKISHPSFI